MDRIQELLAKGIDKLTAEELAELKTLCDEQADALLDESGDEPTDEQVSALETIANAMEQAKARETELEQAKQERAAKLADLRRKIKGGEDDEDDTVEVEEATDDKELEPAGASIEEVEEAEVEEVAEVEVNGQPVTVPVSVTASTVEIGRPNAVVTKVAARRPHATKPKPTAPSESFAPLTASANLPGMQMGTHLDSDEKIARAFEQAYRLAMTASMQPGMQNGGLIKIPVAGMRLEFPEDRILDDNPRANRSKIDKVASQSALTASGGVCAPIPVRYDVRVVSNTARPVKAALARFGATRGGVTTLEPPDLSDFTTATYIKKWTMENDLTPADPVTKPTFTIPCNNTERTTSVYAIPTTVKLGNFKNKWFPELVRAWMDIIATATARQAEAWYLAGIATGSTTVTHGQVLGTARDVTAALRQLIATQRYRLRAPDSYRLDVIAPKWLQDMMLVDLQRIGTDGGTAEERMAMAEQTLNRFFSALNVNPVWHYDYQDGVAIGSAGGPLAGFQGAGPVIGWPSTVRIHVFQTGSWLDLDGGSFDFGIIRDSTLIGTNDFIMFSEIMENVHYDGIVGESFNYDIDICSNGLTVAGGDIDVCTSGS